MSAESKRIQAQNKRIKELYQQAAGLRFACRAALRLIIENKRMDAIAILDRAMAAYGISPTEQLDNLAAGFEEARK